MATVIDYDYILYGNVRPAYDENGACVGSIGTFYNRDGDEVYEIEYPLEEHPEILSALSYLSTHDWDAYAATKHVHYYRNGQVHYDVHYIKRYMHEDSELPKELEP